MSELQTGLDTAVANIPTVERKQAQSRRDRFVPLSTELAVDERRAARGLGQRTGRRFADYQDAPRMASNEVPSPAHRIAKVWP